MYPLCILVLFSNQEGTSREIAASRHSQVPYKVTADEDGQAALVCPSAEEGALESR